MKKHDEYNADPDLILVPLHVEEAELLAERPSLVRRKDLGHVLSRAAATTRQLREERQGFDDEMRRRSAAMPRSAVQPTTSPEHAARFLSPEQLVRLFDRLSQDKLAALEQMRQRASDELDRQEALGRELQQILIDAASDADIPEDVKARLRDLRERASDSRDSQREAQK